MILNEFFDSNKKHSPQQGVAEAINPDITNPEFSHQQKIGDYLYVARYWSKGLKIAAYDGNKLIGRADLMYHSGWDQESENPKYGNPKKFWLESEMTEVHPKYQRKGIMSTMYAYAKMLGNSVKPSDLQSDEAQAAWKSWRQAGDTQHLTKEGVAEGLNEFAPDGFNGGNDSNDLQLYLNVAKKLNMKKYKPSTAHNLIAKKMAELVDVVDDDKVDYARHMARKAQGLPNMLEQGVAEGSLNEFAPGKQGGGGDYLRALASAWYNGTFNTGSLQKGIKSQEDVERVLARGIVCPDGKTRKYNIDYNGDFDGVQIYSDDYYKHGDVDGSTDTRTGRPFGPYDHIEFKGQDLDEGVAEGLNEMDKSQTPPGRDGDIDWTKKQIHLGPEHTMKAKDVAKHALKALDKSMKKSHADTPKKKGVAEVSDATKQNYKARAQSQVRELKPYTKKGEYRDIAQRAIDRRQKGLDRVPDKTNVTSVTESGMKEKSIEFRDYQTMTPGSFHSRYSMTRDEWMARNRNLFSKINPAHQARDTALAKMRQAAAARADVKAAQALAPRVSEAVTTPEGRPALGQANIETLIQTYKQNRPFAELSFGKSGNLNINRQQMRLIMDHYLKLGSPEEKHDFVYETMSRMLKVVAMFNSYGIDVRTQISMPPGQTSQIPGAQPQLFELDASEVKDTRLSRALKQARAEFPTAGSDIEAFLKLVMSNDDRDLATMNRIQTVNTKQSELIDRIQNIDNQQTKEIDDLESQLDRVTSVNQELERQLDAIQAKPKRDDKKDSKPEQSKQPETKSLRRPATPELPVAQAAKASKLKTKKTQQAKPLELPAPAVKAAPLQIGYDPAQASLFGLDKEVSDVIPIYRGQDSANDSAQSPISMYDKEIGSLTQADLDQDAANDTAQPRRQANAESRKPQRAIADTDFDSPEWHEKVRGIGQRAKQGPLKTVWDEKRKVYRNVPVDRPPANNKPNMTEARLQRRAVLLKILES